MDFILDLSSRYGKQLLFIIIALAVAFIITSLSLTVIAARKSSGASVIDRLGTQSTTGAATAPALPDADALLPPDPEDTAPLVPSAD